MAEASASSSSATPSSLSLPSHAARPHQHLRHQHSHSRHISPVVHAALGLGFDVGAAALAYTSDQPSVYAPHLSQTAALRPALSPTTSTSPGGSTPVATSPLSHVTPHSESKPHLQTVPQAHAGPSSQTCSSTSTPGSAGGLGPLRRARARKQRYSRSRTGCLTCRARKVKCDERHPVCTRCLDLEIECQWPDPSFLAYKPRSRRANDGDAEREAVGTGLDMEPAQGLGMRLGIAQGEGGAVAAGPGSVPVSGSGADVAGIAVSAASTKEGGAAAQSTSSAPVVASASSRSMPAAARPRALVPALPTRVRAPGNTLSLTASPAPASLMPPPPVVPIASVPSFGRLVRTPQAHTAPLQPNYQPVSPASSRSSASDAESERWTAVSDTSTLLGGFSLPGIGLVAGSSSAASAAAAASGVSLSGFNPVALLHSLARHPIPGSSTSPTATATASIAPIDSSSSTQTATSFTKGVPVPGTEDSNPRISMESSTLVRRRKINKDRKGSHSSTLNFDFNLSDLAQLDTSYLTSLSAPLVHSIDPLAAAFPTASSRRLFHHFFSLTSSIVVAMSLAQGEGPNRTRNPILNVSLPLIVHDADSPARTAFRLGVMSLAAGHLHHQYLDHGNPGSDDAHNMLIETRRARRHADAQMLLSLTRQGDAELDLVLATCMMLKVRDVVLADRGWKKNLDFALRLILQRGGAVALLAADPHNFSRRFVIEQLATSDVFSTFTTGEEPTLLGHDAPWWLENQKSASTEWQWDAYEYTFGISRGMAEMVAKCRVIAYRKDRVLEAVAVARNASGDTPSSDTSGHVDIDPDMAAIADAIDTEAWALLDKLRIWSIAQQHVPQHSRVLLGDSAYRYAMVVMLLHEVLGVPISDERVQTAVKCVLELCAEISMEPVMLVWPLLIAGARAKGEDRTWVSNLFGIFKKDHCTDLMTAQSLLSEQWRRIDDAQGFTPWPQLMREMDLTVLLI